MGTPSARSAPAKRDRHTAPIRTVALRIPDWPVVAWEVPADEPAAVFVGNRVIAATPAARAFDISIGMRRRQAQSLLPDIRVLDRDEAREHRVFEPVMAQLDSITPRVEIVRPGRCGFAAKGPTRYFGGESAVVKAVDEVMARTLGGLAVCRIGVADGPFAADRAARAAVDGPLVVSPGATPNFLASLPVAVLGRPDLADVLQRLGIRTLGAFASLDPADVSGRFGADGLLAWRLSWGDDGRPLNAAMPPVDLMVETTLDPPVERVDAAAFVLVGIADRFVAGLDARGLACTRMIIAAETEHGERIERCWTYGVAATTPLSSHGIAQRLRWQLDGWLSAHGDGGRGATTHRVPVSERFTGGICRLQLIPEDVVPSTGKQMGLWGGSSDSANRVKKAMARVQGLLGDDAVRVLERSGGRNPGEMWRLVPLDTVDVENRDVSSDVTAGPGAYQTSASASERVVPWPSRLPSPSPAVVVPSSVEPVTVALADRHGRSIKVSGRGEISSVPTTIAVGRGPVVAVDRWAGPWPSEEKWWDALHGRRRARLQIVDENGVAYLVSLEGGRWSIEALWD